MIKDNKGFTLVLALVVLVLLSVMLGLFITMVSVNLRHANRFVAKSLLERVANDGIQYCNNMLVSSADGADWRPVPDNISMKEDYTVADPCVAPSSSDVRNDLADVAASDPDYEYLIAYWPEELFSNGVKYAGPTGGWTRMNSGDNRFLIRVSYNPVVHNLAGNNFIDNSIEPDAKYIKIESLARYGNVDPDDPTTMKPYTQGQKQTYLLAYKPIGITDYTRFVTNKDHLNKTFVFGTGLDGYNEKFGDAETRYIKRSFSARVNGNAEFIGDIVLRGFTYNDFKSDLIVVPMDTIETSGNLEYDGLKFYNQNWDEITEAAYTDDFVKSKGDREQKITEIDAPLMDAKINTGTTRYRQLTRESGKVIDSDFAKGRKSGEFGWGDGIYIDNYGDVQKESETLFGSYTLRSDWLTPGNRFSGNWRGPYYIPPGVYIELASDAIYVQRTDFDRQNRSTVWKDENGKSRPEWGAVCRFPYPKNGVLYAEGNIRIKGMLPENTQLTVVSNENIYIEGNILKNRPKGTSIFKAVDTPENYVTDTRCAISLIARKNVVVNTTVFMKPTMSISSDIMRSDIEGSNEPPFHLRLNPLDVGAEFQWAFQFGPYQSEEDLFEENDCYWDFVYRHSADIDTVDAYLQSFSYATYTWQTLLWGNNSDGYNDNPENTGLYRVRGNTDLGYISGESWKYTYETFNLKPENFGNNAFSLDLTQYLKIFLGNRSKGEYILGNVAVTPMDVRIESLIYAQNGSFFVIPGYWFETDNTNIKGDNKELFWGFGRPLDIRIILDGAISENVCAEKSDQIAWMQKWGKTYHPDCKIEGSDVKDKESYHNGDGFTVLYDDIITYPLAGDKPIRTDLYGRVLPFTPYLPVSPSLIYKGTGE